MKLQRNGTRHAMVECGRPATHRDPVLLAQLAGATLKQKQIHKAGPSLLFPTPSDAMHAAAGQQQPANDQASFKISLLKGEGTGPSHTHMMTRMLRTGLAGFVRSMDRVRPASQSRYNHFDEEAWHASLFRARLPR